MVEPLAAFHGLTRYSFDKRTRLEQKVNALERTVNAAHEGNVPYERLIHKPEVLCSASCASTCDNLSAVMALEFAILRNGQGA